MATKKRASVKAAKPKPVVEEVEEFDEDFASSDILKQISEMPEGDDDSEEEDLESEGEEEELYLSEDAQEKLDKIIAKETSEISAPAIIQERGEGDYEPTSEYPTANHFINRVKATTNPRIVERTPEHNPFLILRDKK